MIKTNLITGFLGSGKTTTIRHLLNHKPADQKWAVLVNEFGEVGIDGALLAGSGALIKEIPGGCICCVNGLPLQIGLNTLLRAGDIDRLLIEPTGLGHPKQLLTLLSSPTYQDWIDLRATLCLLDARNLLDIRVAQHENFSDQLACADVIIANKQDRLSDKEQQAVAQWYSSYGQSRQIVATQQGSIDLTLLDLPRLNNQHETSPIHTHRAEHANPLKGLSLLANQRWRRHLNQGQGYFSCGWVFDKDTQFDTHGMETFVRQLDAPRVKAVMRIRQGQLYINRQGDDIECQTLPLAPADSRLEIIANQPLDWNKLQSQLLSLRLM